MLLNCGVGEDSCESLGLQGEIDHWNIEKARKFQRNIYFYFIDKAFDCVDHNELCKILQDHLTGLLYVCQEATARTRHEIMDWSKLGKEYGKAVYCRLAY